MGAHKKVLLCIFSAFFVLSFLAAPTPNNSKVSAQASCNILSAKMEPSSTGKDSDSKATETIYINRQPSGLPVKIKVAVENCKDQSVSLTLVEGGAVDNIITGYASSIKTNTVAVTGLGPYQNIKDNAPITLDFDFLAGDDLCSLYAPGYSDCHYDFKVFVKSSAANAYSSENGTEVYDSTDDEMYGNLYYDRDEPTASTEKWVYVGGSSSFGNTIQKQWYFKLTGGTWSNSGKFTKDECKAARDAAPGSDKSVDCTQEPPLDKLTEGALSGVASATPECDITPNWADGDPTNIPACVTEIAFQVIFLPLATITGWAGQFFDALFAFSISSEIYGGGGANVGFLKVAWTFVRDIVNLGFILTLLWIAILQITSPVKYDAKKKIPGIIVIALVINFSYFFGTVIIDTTNILARFLYNNDAICINTNDKCDGEISEAIIAAFNPQTLIERSSKAFQEATGKEEMSVAYYAVILIMSIWVTWKMFMMFFKIATLFLGRIIQLWVHLVLSPIAFINVILPKKIGSKDMSAVSSPEAWATEFFKNAFIAPLFMFFVYLILLLISGFDFVKTAFSTHATHGDFLVIITMIFPFFVIMILMDSAVKKTQEQAGKIANDVSGFINKAVGAVAGTALALATTAGGGLIVKRGSRLLGNMSKKLIAKEGRGKNVLSRGWNSMQAKAGGYLNDYAKKLPDKKLDIRENSKITNFVKNATGFDMTESKAGINSVLKRGGIRPDESFNERNDRRAKEAEAEIARRKIEEKTNKMDSELEILNKQRRVEMYTENDKSAKQKFEHSRNLARQNAQQLGKAFDENAFIKEYEEKNKQKIEEWEKANAEKANAYKTKTAGSAELFEASNREAYEKAAKNYNKKVDSDYVMKKKRDVYGGKNDKETNENMANNNRTGPYGLANNADIGIAGHNAGVASLVGSVVGAATGAGVAGALVYGANASYKRDGDLEFIRRRENKKDKAAKKKADKIDAQIEAAEISNNRQETILTDLGQKIKKLSSIIKENTTTVKTVGGDTTKSFKDVFDAEFKKLSEENEKRKINGEKVWSEAKLESEVFKNSYNNFSEEANKHLQEIAEAMKTATDTRKEELKESLDKLNETLREIGSTKNDLNKASVEHEKTLSAIDKGHEKINKLRESQKEKSEEKAESKKDDKK